MTFLKSVKSAAALLMVAGVLVFAGGAFAAQSIAFTTPDTPVNAYVGNAYSQTVTATGFTTTGQIEWSVEPALPTGLSLSGDGTATGTVSGTVTAATGTVASTGYVIKAKNSGSSGDGSEEAEITLTFAVVNPPVPVISGVSVTRTSASAATVKFTSTIAGTGYAVLLASSATEPENGKDIEDDGDKLEWETVTTAEYTKTGITVTANDTVIYFTVKTALGAYSEVTKVTVPAAPVITIVNPPTDKTFTVGYISGTLTVNATISPSTGNRLKYQWYSASSSGGAGTTLGTTGGAQTATLTIPASITADTWYYVEVTGETTAGQDNFAAKVTSTRAKVTVSAASASVSGNTVGTVKSVGAQSKDVYFNGKADTVTVRITVTGSTSSSIDNTKFFKPKFIQNVAGITFVTPKNSAGADVAELDSVKFSGSGADRTVDLKLAVAASVGSRTAVTNNTLVVLFDNATGKIDKSSTVASNFITITVKPKNVRVLSVDDKSVTYSNGTRQGVNVPSLSGTGATISSPSYTYIYSDRDAVRADTFSTVAAALLNVGRYRATVALQHDTDTGTVTANFTIVAKPVTAEMITLSQTSVAYNGEERFVGVSVKDGSVELKLGPGGDYISNIAGKDASDDKDDLFENNVNAGTAKVKIRGSGNYTGTAEKSFTIAQKQISIVSLSSTVTPRVYNGKTTLAAGNVSLAFDGLVNDEEIGADGYTIANLRLSSQNVAANLKALGTVSLVATHAVAKNYKFSGATANFESQAGSWITPKAAVKADFTFDTSLQHKHFYTGTRRGIGAVSYDTSFLAQPSGHVLKTLYVYGSDSTSEVIPVDAGNYTVKVKIEKNANFDLTGGQDVVEIGEYVIADPLPATVSKDLPSDTTVRRGKTVVLSVAAKSPNPLAGDSVGAVKYQWYRVVNDTGKAAITGATNASYTYNTVSGRDSAAVGTTVKFFVSIINAPGATVQVPDTAQSRTVTVTVDEAAKPIETARVTVGEGDYVYSGDTIKPSSVSVTLGSETLSDGTDYTYTLVNAVNAGTALVRVEGIGKYEGVANGTYTIAKKVLEPGDLAFAAATVYNGQPQPLVVTASGGRTGLGTTVVTYNGAATVPVNAGTYAITVRVNPNGNNFTGSDSAYTLGDYVIVQKVAVAADLDYTPYDDQILVADAPKTGIGSVSLKAGTGFGKLTVLYNGDTTVPTTVGSYQVLVEISGDTNFIYTLVELPSYNLVDVIGVAQASREVPKAGVTQAVSVAPVKVAAKTFTAGPSPVSKNGVVKFFSSKQVKSGSLYVFDVSGGVVAKVAAKPGVGEIGSWKATGVSEGTYVVKGALVGKDGTREKVSFVFSVVR